ncbi:hypothetical protein TESG_00393 [Trichophyton tonsurans CBS 112818]|uniref:Uncharacterized protein n=1 Tax=Trichophyton tonsurans (strain CBS 112818) TaxID=647933 RepID=F2RNC7_TRIT1|nr:hypothetical protein TESG_00393 [Trichophyton tonsurans CBS 112818]
MGFCRRPQERAAVDSLTHGPAWLVQRKQFACEIDKPLATSFCGYGRGALPEVACVCWQEGETRIHLQSTEWRVGTPLRSCLGADGLGGSLSDGREDKEVDGLPIHALSSRQKGVVKFLNNATRLRLPADGKYDEIEIGGSGTRARAGSVSLFGQFFFVSPSLMGDVRVGSPGARLRSASDA